MRKSRTAISPPAATTAASAERMRPQVVRRHPGVDPDEAGRPRVTEGQGQGRHDRQDGRPAEEDRPVGDDQGSQLRPAVGGPGDDADHRQVVAGAEGGADDERQDEVVVERDDQVP